MRGCGRIRGVVRLRQATGFFLALAGVAALAAPAALRGATGPPIAPGAASLPPTPADAQEFFEKRVRPVLVQHCYSCHSDRSPTPGGGLRLDSREGLMRGGGRGPAALPGRPDDSVLIKAVRQEGSALRMPPNGRLSPDAVADLRQWISGGAVWGAPLPVRSAAVANPQSHWGFRPLLRPEVPAVRQAGWVRTPVDAFVLRELEAKGLRPAPETDRRTWIRRVTFDLIGLPPSPEEVRAFLADVSPRAYEIVVDRLLASPHYGERWARHWLDLVRYAETDGHEFDFDKAGAYHYRDYVIRALNADVPYNQFVQEHLAGDLLSEPRLHPDRKFNESILATGFWWLGEGKHSPVDLRVDEAERYDNQMDVLGKAFLGLSLGCARCHDHKFDPIPTKDYYALFGYLRSSHYQTVDVADPQQARKSVAQLVSLNVRLHSTIPPAAASRLATAIRQMPADLEHALVGRTNAGPRVESWRRILKDAAARPADPWHPLAVLGARRGEDFEQERQALLRRGGEHASAQPVRVFEEFQHSNYQGWSVTGAAFGEGPTRRFLTRPGAPGSCGADGVIEPGVAYSAAAADRLHGALRSRTFTLEHPHVWIRAAGREGEVRLVVDNFQRIRNPIYGGLAIPVKQGPQPAWFGMDVSKWIGHQAYFEFLDSGPGFLAVDRICFGKTPPPVPVNPVADRVLSASELRAPADLIQAYTRGLNEALSAWRNDTLSGDPDADVLLPLLNWALTTDVLGAAPAAGGTAAGAPEMERLLAEYRKLEESIPTPNWAMAMTDGTGEDEPVHIRGDHRALGDVSPRRYLTVFAGQWQTPAGVGSGRLVLADRVLRASRPLVARVAVNRVWQHFFGEGLVRTPDDFGLRGDPPTHPALLDWLATAFSSVAPASVTAPPPQTGASAHPDRSRRTAARSRLRTQAGTTRPPLARPAAPALGWSPKSLHRLLVLSSTYRMDSRGEAPAEAADPQNRLLHRMPVRRLEAEVIRDTVLAVSQRLDRAQFGPGVMPHLTDYLQGRGRPATSGPLDGDGRRSIYLAVRRNFLNPMFLAFDYPVPFNTMGRRSVSTVPSQALTLMNNPFVQEQAKVWALHALRETAPTATARIERLYEAAFARPPTGNEVASAVAFLAERAPGKPEDLAAWGDLCHVLMNVKEFVFLR